MGDVYLVATPIGNLGDMSPRAIDVMRMVDIIAAEDTRRTVKLLNHFDIKTTLISYHKFNERERSEELLKYVTDGASIAIVSDAGTPCISDPGCEIILKARERGINVYSVPGASAITSAVSASGFGMNGFVFLGFIPRDNRRLKRMYEMMAASFAETFVMFESPRRVTHSLLELSRQFPNAMACVFNDITKLYEKTYWGSIGHVAELVESNVNSQLGEYTIVMQIPHAEPDDDTEKISVEAMLIDVMVKQGGGLKQAVKRLSADGGVSKNDAYRASLSLKSIFDNMHD